MTEKPYLIQLMSRQDLDIAASWADLEGWNPGLNDAEGMGAGASAAPGREDIVDVSMVPFEALVAYDQSCFPCDRTPFLRCWIHLPDSAALGILQRDKLAGYRVIRPARRGYKIGSLFADDSSGAEALLMALTSRVASGAPIYLDVPTIKRREVSVRGNLCS